MFHFHDYTSFFCITPVISSNYFFVMISYILSHFPRFEHPQTFSVLFLCTFLNFGLNFFYFWLICFAKHCYTYAVTRKNSNCSTSSQYRPVEPLSVTNLTKPLYTLKLRAAKRIRQNEEWFVCRESDFWRKR